MLNKKIMMLAILIIIPFVFSTVSATDNVTGDVVSAEEITDYAIVDATNEVVIVEDNSTQDIDFDLLGGEGYEIDKNTVSFNLNGLNVPYYENDYYIFDYDDGNNTKELSCHWIETHAYSYNLNLTKNSNYTYTFYGHTTIVGHLHGRPWTYGQYSDSNLILQGSFKTDNYGNIIDFNHDQHLKLVLSNYNNSCIIVSMSKPFGNSYNLNGEFAGLSKGKKLNVGMNSIEETYQNNNYIQNYVKKTFNIFVHDNSGVKTFTELAAKINSGETEIILDCDYKYNSRIDTTFQSGILISNSLVIDGNGHTLDGNEESKILIVSGSDVTIKNVIFTNTFSNSTQTNAALHWNGNNGILDNCSFIQLNVKYGISALYMSGWNAIINNCLFKNNVAKNGNTFELSGNDVQIINCSFVNNSAESGGAIHINYAINTHLNNCSFINNTGKYYGGAVYWNGNGGVLYDCLFINNTISSLWGGAIAWRGNEGILSNCSFYNNSAISHNGGAIYWNGEDCIIKNSLFENNHALFYGSAILVSSDESIITNCSFVNNSAKSGSIRVSGDQSIVKHCSFKNNYVSEKGGAIYWDGNDGSLLNCNFINCSSKENIGNAVYWAGNNGLINLSYFSPEFNTIYNETSDFKIIKKYLSKISFENVTFNYNNINFSTHLNTYGKLIFNIFNESENMMIIKNTANDGSILLNSELNKLNSGKWNVSIIFEGNDNYYPCNATAILTVLPSISSVNVDDINMTAGHEVTIVASVNSTLTVDEGVVIFFDGPNHIGEANVVDGVAVLTYTPATAGEHTISAIFNSNNYLTTNSTRTVNVEKASTIIFASDMTVSYNDGQFMRITLNDDNGNLISGATLSIDLNGTKTFDTDANGQIKVPTEGLKPNVYIATIKFEGNSNYEKSNASVVLIVSDYSSIVAANINVVYSAGSYYTIKVYGTGGKLVDGAKVVITVNGKTFKTLTTTNGVAKFKVTNVPGTYKMNITALDKSVIKTLTVKHLVTLKSVTVKKSAKKLTLQSTLGKVNGKYLKNKKITFKFNGKKYTAKTDKKGVAKVTIKSSVLKKLKVGKKVTYQATYSKDTVKKTVKVKK